MWIRQREICKGWSFFLLWKELFENFNSKKLTSQFFYDLRRAFETLNREFLFRILYSYGVRGLELQWIKSFILNRTQFVHLDIGNRISRSVKRIMGTGIPHGSTLGPVLFLLYFYISITLENSNSNQSDHLVIALSIPTGVTATKKAPCTRIS